MSRLRSRWLLILLMAMLALLTGAFAAAAGSKAGRPKVVRDPSIEAPIDLPTKSPAEPHSPAPDEKSTVLDSVGKTLVIGLGESVRVDIANGAKVHISDGGVVRARVIGQSVLLTGQRTGKTSLRVLNPTVHARDQDRTLVVTERKIASTVRLFQNHIVNGRGLKMNTSALPALIVTGELLRLEDWAELVTFAKEAKVPWRLEAKIFPEIRKTFREKIESELTRLAWPGQRLSIDENGPTLTAGSESLAMTAEQKLAVTTLGVQIETAAGLTELEPMVRTQIVIAEVRSKRVHNLGVKWDGSIKGTALPSLQIPTEVLKFELQAMEEDVSGRILAMPTLLCRSGGEAKFMAGGEIPIRLVSERTAAVDWKKYGILLNVQPKADRMKRMKLQLSTEISTLDSANGIDGVPGILTNKIDTQFNLNGAQTIVLSGLIKNEEGTTRRGIPLLRSIPILGSLFDSEDFRKNLTELIIFVSPEVIVPENGGTHD